MHTLRFLIVIALHAALRGAAAEGGGAASVTELAAEFRAGQTFVTWRQTGDSAQRYDIHRNGVKLATVGSHTALNVLAVVDRMKLSNTRAPDVYELPERRTFVIRDGGAPLAEDHGLFVHTAKAEEDAEFAVTRAGAELNAGTPRVRVRERVEFPQAVRQNETDFVHWTDDVGTPLYPAMSSLPSVPYNFRVRAPQGAGPFPLIGFLHGALMHFTKTQIGGEAEAHAVRIALDSPIMRGEIKGLAGERWAAGAWYGYNENWGTDRPEESGRIVDFVARRVLWTLEWAEKNYPIDADRVSLRGGSMGGIGSLVLGLLHPERFAAIHAHIPPLRMSSRAAPGGFLAMMMPIVPTDFIRRLGAAPELPYLLITAGRTDQIVGWPDKLEFAQALREEKRAFTFYWDLRNHDGTFAGEPPADLQGPAVPWGRNPGWPEMSVVTFSRKQSFPAFDAFSLDDNPGSVNFATRPNQRPPWNIPGAGDFVGSFNGAADWERDTIVDTADRWEITLRLHSFARAPRATANVTPRRLQQLRPRPGEVFRFEWRDGDAIERGEVTADEDGLLTVPGVPLTSVGVRLVITRR